MRLMLKSELPRRRAEAIRVPFVSAQTFLPMNMPKTGWRAGVMAGFFPRNMGSGLLSTRKGLTKIFLTRRPLRFSSRRLLG